ncbi:hypothetical protein FF38_07635 [Lucilia cuprina]|uniref:Uncharacterized protein n=1 Tax=Lucilia cuprina TaxID=7375 RepID=A0A0L0CJ27_LUCCU|nr:hypothetical protein FF38_07635 [Lucilia cuprina]
MFVQKAASSLVPSLNYAIYHIITFKLATNYLLTLFIPHSYILSKSPFPISIPFVILHPGTQLCTNVSFATGTIRYDSAGDFWQWRPLNAMWWLGGTNIPKSTGNSTSVQDRLGERQLVRPSHRDYRHRANPNRRRPTNSQPQRHRTANTNHQYHRRHTTNFHRRRTNTSSTRTSRQHPRRINSTIISQPNNDPPAMPNRVISEAIRSLAAVLCATSNN